MKVFPVRSLVACAALFAAISGIASPPANYSGQDLQHKDFKDGNLNNAKFDGANLTGANLSNATLKAANFQKAILQHAILNRAMMDDADFTGADLTAVDWTDARAWHAHLAGTQIDLAGSHPLDLKKLNLDYDAEKIIQSGMRNDSGTLSFHYADMRGCKFAGNAEGVDFRGADLRDADFTKAENVDKARLSGAKYNAATRWNINPAAMHAELVPDAPDAGQHGQTALPKLSHHPLIGNWLVMKGEKGATEGGSLRIHADGTFDWDYSATAAPITGKWDEVGDNILLKAGEKGENWTVKRTAAEEVLLSGDKGTERVAISNK